MDQVVIRTVTGTGANLDIDLGFTPERVEVLNLTDTTNFPELRWTEGMPNASAIKRSLSTFSRITTLGITPLGDAAGDTKQGFRIGADAAVNVNGNTLQYSAFRSASPKR